MLIIMYTVRQRPVRLTTLRVGSYKTMDIVISVLPVVSLGYLTINIASELECLSSRTLSSQFDLIFPNRYETNPALNILVNSPFSLSSLAPE